MVVGPEKIDIVDLAAELEECNLKDQKVAVILGAKMGALFRSQHFRNVMSNFSIRTLAELSPYDSFTECFTILQREKQRFGYSDLRSMLNRALENIQISPTELCLAELVQLKMFKMLITTNPGNLLETAFQVLKMTEDSKGKEEDKLDYLTFTPERHDAHNIAFHENLLACKLIKIHDDVPTFMHNLFTADTDSVNSRFIKDLLGLMRVKRLLIIGADLRWDEFLLSILPDKIEKVWFVNEDEAVMQTFYASYSAKIAHFHFIAGTNGTFDKFLKMLYWQLTNGISPTYYELSRELRHQLLIVQSELDQIKKEQSQLKEICKEITEVHHLLDFLVKDFEDFRKNK